MFLPQQSSKTIAVMILIASMVLVMLLVFARFMPGTFTSLNRAFFNNHALGVGKKNLKNMGRAATKTMRTRTGAHRPPASPPPLTPPAVAPKGP